MSQRHRGKPDLRPAVPTEPAQSIINFDGAATWPHRRLWLPFDELPAVADP